jgi:hypothetical protein
MEAGMGDEDVKRGEVVERGPSIADARGVGGATRAPVVVVITQDQDGAVLAASWGKYRGACRAADRLMRAALKLVGAQDAVAAERPDDDGEAGVDEEDGA